MGVVNSAVTAMDAHRNVAAVAEHGLRFLLTLSVADGAEVRCGGVDRELSTGMSHRICAAWSVPDFALCRCR
jgi:hypothetical protein